MTDAEYWRLQAEAERIRTTRLVVALRKIEAIGAHFDEATRDDSRDLGIIIDIARKALAAIDA